MNAGFDIVSIFISAFTNSFADKDMLLARVKPNCVKIGYKANLEKLVLSTYL